MSDPTSARRMHLDHFPGEALGRAYELIALWREGVITLTEARGFLGLEPHVPQTSPDELKR